MKYVSDPIPFWSRLWLSVAYGWKNRKATIAMYSAILRHERLLWEDADWRAELKSVMFAFNPPSYAKDMSWKTMKKTGMKKSRWKLLSAKSLPDDRPDRWDAVRKRHAVHWALLPESYLRRFVTHGSFLKYKLDESFDGLVADIRGKSVAELTLQFAANPPDVGPEDLACLLFMGWCSATAHCLRMRSNIVGTKQFHDWGFGDDFYEKVLRVIGETDAFDRVICDRFYWALDALGLWYYRPHCITGMFSVLEPIDIYDPIAPGPVAKALRWILSGLPTAESKSACRDEALHLAKRVRNAVMLRVKTPQ